MEDANIKVARLEVQMTDTKTQLNRVESKVDTMLVKLDDFQTLNVEIQNLKREIGDQKIMFEEKIRRLEQHRFLTGWLYPTLSAAAAFVLATLILYAINKK